MNLKKNGFTLIEIILFIVVFSIGITGIVLIFTNIIGKSSSPIVREKGIQIAQSVMEEIFSKKFDEKTPNGGGTVTNPTLGPDLGETSISLYDDVDDYVDEGTEFKKEKDNYHPEDFGLSPDSNFTIKVIVQFVTINASHEIIPVNAKTDFKMITVIVKAKNLNENYKVVAVKGNF